MVSTILFDSLLVLGPTGAGKTPFGSFCEHNGLWGRKCAHFDFGHELRKAAEGDRNNKNLSGADLGFIRSVLSGGALLEDDRFYIARALFSHFVEKRGLVPDHLIVLNGLPRHRRQAERMSGFVNIKAVLRLVCETKVVEGRIRLDTGGDRAGRVDDSLGDIAAKLRLYNNRTLPLADYFRACNVPVIERTVGINTSPGQIHESLNSVNPL